METKAQDAEALAATTQGQDALNHAIKAAELYMKAAGEAENKAAASRCRRKCQELITFAEKLKIHLAGKATPINCPTQSSSASSSILKLGSRLHGNEFPPWGEDPSAAEFEAARDKVPFTDDTYFALSATQTENFAAWVRPMELFNLAKCSNTRSLEDIMMQASDKSDFVQDITTDCSVVASLSAAFNVLTGKHGVLSSVMHPFDNEKGRPKLSDSGKYVMKLNFNGCARKVVIDDRLPSSRTDRALFVIDRCNQNLLWPALLEKAYLKVRGGYDFPGSNSGTDLWMLIGWIPEQIFLQREDIDIDDIWRRIHSAHESQDVVITLGTGRISAEEEEVMGLIGEHDYAVEDIQSSGGHRRLLIKNPWCDGPSMTKLGWFAPTDSNVGSSDALPPIKHSGSNSDPSRLWVAFEDVTQHFESMYVNWNPALFHHRQDHHFSWKVPPKIHGASLYKNPQFSVISGEPGAIWILISRHFADAELDIARGRRGSMAAVARQLGYMSILVFENNGKKVQIGDGEVYRGPYVDSPQTLARLKIKPGQPYTIVIDQHEFPLTNYSFTMSLFSQHALEVREASETMSQFTELAGCWSRHSAGGNASCSTYFQNPQYSLTIDKASPVSVLLSADTTDIHVHVDVVWAQGDRVTSLRVKDLVATSGEFRRGCAVADISMLEPGVYTLVCSTFDAGQLAEFLLRVASMTTVKVAAIPADRAGMLITKLPLLSLSEGDEKRCLSIDASWLTKASVAIKSTVVPQHVNRTHPPSSLVVRTSVIHGWGPQLVTIAVSGENEFQDPTNIIRTPYFDMEPDRIRREGLRIVVESMGSHDASLAIDGEIMSDSPVKIGAWESV